MYPSLSMFEEDYAWPQRFMRCFELISRCDAKTIAALKVRMRRLSVSTAGLAVLGSAIGGAEARAAVEA